MRKKYKGPWEGKVEKKFFWYPIFCSKCRDRIWWEDGWVKWDYNSEYGHYTDKFCDKCKPRQGDL